MDDDTRREHAAELALWQGGSAGPYTPQEEVEDLKRAYITAWEAGQGPTLETLLRNIDCPQMRAELAEFVVDYHEMRECPR